MNVVILTVAGWFLTSLYWFLACGWVAKEKGRGDLSWGLLGFFLWFLAFLPLAVAPPRRN